MVPYSHDVVQEYDPLRFLPEKCDERDSFAYILFSAGPRSEFHTAKSFLLTIDLM